MRFVKNNIVNHKVNFMGDETTARSSEPIMTDYLFIMAGKICVFSMIIIMPLVMLAEFILSPQNYNINIQHDLTTWLVATIFPAGSLICVYFVSARISAQWKKRYPSENFDEIEIPKRKIDTLYHFMIIPSFISWSFVNYTFDILRIFVCLILGIVTIKIYTVTIPPTAHPRDVEKGVFWFIGMTIIFTITWFLSLLIIPYYSSYIFLVPFGLGAGGVIHHYQESHNKDMNKIKNLRSAIESEEDSTSFFSYIQHHISDPPTPFFYPLALNFLTHTNSEYPWENQSNPDSILALIYSHKNKIFLTDVLIVALIIVYPPALVWVIYLTWLEPSHIRRTMSANMRLKYDQLIERCEEFCDIEYVYEDSVEYSIKSITPKFSDLALYRCPKGVERSVHFGYPERPLGANFFKDYEYVQRRVEELEMIRDKGIMYDPDSSMALLVNQFSWEDRLSRYINKLELDYLPIKTAARSVKPSNDKNASLDERLYDQIYELKDRLQQHETILNRLAEDGRWRYVYEEKRAKNALNDIRTCTESLLHSRCEKLGKEFAPHKRNLDAMIGWLKSEKVGDLDRVGGKYAERIRITVNPATHAMHASDDEYVKALEDFVHLVEWHVENPPNSRGT